MKKYNKKVKKPISLAGCEQVLKQCGIPYEEYSQWNITDIFDKAEELAKNYDVDIEEVAIDPSK